MSEKKNIFVLGTDARPELVLFATSLGRSLARGHELGFVAEEPEDLIERDEALRKLCVESSSIEVTKSRLIVCGDSELTTGRAVGNLWRLSLVDEPSPYVRLESEGARHRFPLAMSSSIVRPYGRSVSEISRVLVVVNGSQSRRDRMIARVEEELARRKWLHSLVCIADSLKQLNGLEPSEVYERPEASELAALIATSSLMLETVEGSDPVSAVACLAASVGVPVVTHASSHLGQQGPGETRRVNEWSPDAFADEVIAASDTPVDDLSWGTEFEAVVDDFGRVIQFA